MAAFQTTFFSFGKDALVILVVLSLILVIQWLSEILFSRMIRLWVVSRAQQYYCIGWKYVPNQLKHLWKWGQMTEKRQLSCWQIFAFLFGFLICLYILFATVVTSNYVQVHVFRKCIIDSISDQVGFVCNFLDEALLWVSGIHTHLWGTLLAQL